MKPRLEIRFDKEYRRAFRSRKPLSVLRENVFLLNHARSGLLLTLQALGLPHGSGVGVMAYNCHTVMNAVAQAGYVPVFVDVNDQLQLDLDDLQRKSEAMRVLIVTHLFGIENDIKYISQRFPKLIVIEDCAHAFGKPIEGDFGVYSVGQGKFPSLGDGGILVVNNLRFLEPMNNRYQKLSNYSCWGETVLYFKLWMTSLLQRPLFYGWLTRPLKQLRKRSSGKEPVVMKRMSVGIQALLEQQRGDLAEEAERRKVNAVKEIERLKENPLIKKVLLGNRVFMLPVLSSDLEALRTQYAQRGIETATHFANSIAWAKEFGYQGDCPNAERLLHEILVIPVY